LNIAPLFDTLLIVSNTLLIECQVLCGYYHVAVRLNGVSQNSLSKLIKMRDVIT